MFKFDANENSFTWRTAGNNARERVIGRVESKPGAIRNLCEGNDQVRRIFHERPQINEDVARLDDGNSQCGVEDNKSDANGVFRPSGGRYGNHYNRVVADKVGGNCANKKGVR